MGLYKNTHITHTRKQNNTEVNTHTHCKWRYPPFVTLILNKLCLRCRRGHPNVTADAAFFSYFTFPSKFVPSTHPLKQARLTWNVNTMYKTVSVRAQAFLFGNWIKDKNNWSPYEIQSDMHVCERHGHPPRSKRCDGKSISLRQGV